MTYNPPKSIQMLVKTGPAFSIPSAVAIPQTIHGSSVPKADFIFGSRVANVSPYEPEIYFGSVVGMTFIPDVDFPHWEYTVRWDGEDENCEDPCAEESECYSNPHARRRGKFADAVAIVDASEISVCTCGTRFRSETEDYCAECLAAMEEF